VKSSLIYILLQNSLLARESFEFNLGQKLNILSDKAFRKTKENEFEAVGNVVITHLKNSIYGEKAKLNFNTGETFVEGNVRYISPTSTLYGTKLQYNFLTREIYLFNARIISDSYTIVGKEIIQKSSSHIVAKEAEYTTCKDCPESWSVFGNKIDISLGQYVRISHAFIKANGVIVMYIPYIVFPIKQKRETGLLFPSISYKSDEGLKYLQPYFWAINDYSDVTFAPGVFGSRGYGGEFQYRHNLAESTWVQANSLLINDKIYEPYKNSKDISGDKVGRYFSDLEFHSSYKNIINGHFYYNRASDLDTKRDFSFFTNERIDGSEVGGGGFLDFRSSLLNLTVESYYNENLLVKNPKKFDDQYVQMLPKISLSTIPYNLFHSDIPFFKNVSLGMRSDYTIFKQNKFLNTGVIRNANRLNLNPFLEWQLGNAGPVFFSHTLKWDYQNYYLPKETQKRFTKKGFVYETEAKLELERIFGISYVEEKPIEIQSTVNKNNTMVGEIPPLNEKSAKEVQSVFNNSYRHSQEFKLKHYTLSNQNYSGNQQFYNQILKENGQFDYVDAVRAKEHSVSAVAVQDSLPLSNTVEFQWNNNLIRKTSRIFDPFQDGNYLKDNFNYKNIAFFELSQGLDLNVKSDKLNDRLTRLYVNTGLNLDSSSVNLEEFYFHRTSEHKLSTSFSYNFSNSSVGSKFTYNSFNSNTTAVTKILGFNLDLFLNDLFRFKTNFDYDLKSKLFNSSFYSLTYSPTNNCWKAEINYAKDQIEKRIGFIFYINYNENNFASLNIH